MARSSISLAHPSPNLMFTGVTALIKHLECSLQSDARKQRLASKLTGIILKVFNGITF